jgi:GTP-binding protein
MAAINYNVKPLINKVAEMLSALPPIRRYKEEELERPDETKLQDKSVNIIKENDVYFVTADWLLNTIRGTNFDDYDSFQYFQRLLNKTGVSDALKEAGVKDGDTVCIYDMEFEYID